MNPIAPCNGRQDLKFSPANGFGWQNRHLYDARLEPRRVIVLWIEKKAINPTTCAGKLRETPYTKSDQRRLVMTECTKSMKNSLINVRRTLHELLKALPAVKANCSQEAIQKHMTLIRFYQKRYDFLVASSAPVPA